MKEKFLERMRRKNAEQKRINYSLLAGLAILLISLGLYVLFQFSSVQRSYLYPYPYQDEVRQYAEEYEVDSDLVIAVIKTESNFKEKAKSTKRYEQILEVTGSRIVPAWLECDREALKGTVKSLPTREEIDVPVDELQIVELYSK